MNNDTIESRFEVVLDGLRQQGQYRMLNSVRQDGIYLKTGNTQLINLASNDYLGIAGDKVLRADFMQTVDWERTSWSASSSRLLTGNFEAYDALEMQLALMFGKEAALVFNSGYHMNIGILPAIATSKTLILADKLVHASLIDGIRLSKAQCIRYRHGDLNQLENLLKAKANSFEQVIIVTESVFSMDGDKADLNNLVQLKSKFDNVLIYVDEAHGVGVMGASGIGLAEELNCIKEIDFLVGTFGKALGSVGGYIVCTKLIKEYLINKMRPLIYSTALPPINIAWSKFILERLGSFQSRSARLKQLSARLKNGLLQKGYTCNSESHIIAFILGSSEKALGKSEELKKRGFYIPALRPPTVPEGSARIRISMDALIEEEMIDNLLEYL